MEPEEEPVSGIHEAWAMLVHGLLRLARLRRLWAQLGAHLRMVKDRGRQSAEDGGGGRGGEGKGGGGAGKITDCCRDIVPDEETIVFADAPDIGLFIDEFIFS